MARKRSVADWTDMDIVDAVVTYCLPFERTADMRGWKFDTRSSMDRPDALRKINDKLYFSFDDGVCYLAGRRRNKQDIIVDGRQEPLIKPVGWHAVKDGPIDTVLAALYCEDYEKWNGDRKNATHYAERIIRDYIMPELAGQGTIDNYCFEPDECEDDAYKPSDPYFKDSDYEPVNRYKAAQKSKNKPSRTVERHRSGSYQRYVNGKLVEDRQWGLRRRR